MAGKIIFGRKKSFLGETIFWPEKSFLAEKKHFGRKFIWSKNHFLTKNFFGRKNHFCEKKYFLAEKIFAWKNHFCVKNHCPQKSFLRKKSLAAKIFCVQKFLVNVFQDQYPRSVFKVNFQGYSASLIAKLNFHDSHLAIIVQAVLLFNIKELTLRPYFGQLWTQWPFCLKTYKATFLSIMWKLP